MFAQKLPRLARATAAVFLFAAMAAAAPPLTTIQDVLYKADGSRFNGVVVIGWNTFEAADTSNITAQSITLRIVDGNLRVQLVPNLTSNPPGYYSVRYNSDGKAQFSENWAVPESSSPLRVRDVRVSMAPAALDAGTAPLQETDIIGLTADLAVRPIKGPGYAPGRAVWINANGALEAVSGDLADCVRVDGSSGPCGSMDAAPSFVDAEVPAGIVDGANGTFTLAGSPTPALSLALYRNGVLQKSGLDFNLTGNFIEFLPVSIPQPGDTILASYRLSGLVAGGSSLPAGPVVLCAGAGSSTTASTMTSLGSCTIPADTLRPGDRLEIQFDYSHEGSSTGFAFRVLWGSTVLTERNGGADDVLITGRAESAIHASGAQLSAQSWGTLLPFSVALTNTGDSLSTPLTINFLGNMAGATVDSLTLRNFTVTRYAR